MLRANNSLFCGQPFPVSRQTVIGLHGCQTSNSQTQYSATMSSKLHVFRANISCFVGRQFLFPVQQCIFPANLSPFPKRHFLFYGLPFPVPGQAIPIAGQTVFGFYAFLTTRLRAGNACFPVKQLQFPKHTTPVFRAVNSDARRALYALRRATWRGA